METEERCELGWNKEQLVCDSRKCFDGQREYGGDSATHGKHYLHTNSFFFMHSMRMMNRCWAWVRVYVKVFWMVTSSWSLRDSLISLQLETMSTTGQPSSSSVHVPEKYSRTQESTVGIDFKQELFLPVFFWPRLFQLR